MAGGSWHNLRVMLRKGLSLLIVLHCAVLLVAPYRTAHDPTARDARDWLERYTRPLSFGVQWSFFAPEPGPPPVYVEWELLDREQKSLERGTWPETWDGFAIRERQNKRTQAGRFVSQNDLQAEAVLLPFLCKTHPGAHAVKLWRVQETLPRMEEVRSGQRKIGDRVGADHHYVSHSFCPEPGEQNG